MKAHIHYEKAFEGYLRSRQIPYVAVDEAKRAAFRDARLKSFDFIVYSARNTNWLADVKGRRWTTRKGHSRPVWENWVTQADLDGLGQWQQVFGPHFRALLVFAYWLDLPAGDQGCGQQPAPPPEIEHVHCGERYVFAGVPLDEYRCHARLRSPKWGTVNMPAAQFARHVRPLGDWL